MKVAITMRVREQAVLTVDEMRREVQAPRDKDDDETMEQFLSNDLSRQLSATLTELDEGGISEAEAVARMEASGRQFEERVEKSDNPALIMTQRAGKAAELKGLPPIARLLVQDANTREPPTVFRKHKWIAEVLQGHMGDDAAQRGCLAYIVKLWSEGLPLWPMDAEGE